MNAGQIAAVNSAQQKTAKIQDSIELMMADMRKAGVDLNHPNLIRTIAERSNETVLDSTRIGHRVSRTRHATWGPFCPTYSQHIECLRKWHSRAAPTEG
jgi:succinate dehydrogenase/fumarate reductase flavoprotein subunit